MRSRPTFADLLAYNLAVLREAAQLAALFLPRPEDFAARAGPHLRHVVEHFDALLAGIERGGVDYDHRERDPAVERQPAYCIERIERLCGQLAALEVRRPDDPIRVGFVIGAGGESFSLSQSTLARELQFVSSHAIHHFALLRPVLVAAGFEVSPDLGKAPDTLRHQAGQAGR